MTRNKQQERLGSAAIDSSHTHNSPFTIDNSYFCKLFMQVNYGQYETVVGLEVHAQLLTNSKLFCGDSTAFGAEPNTQVSEITLAHPGTLPKMNKKAIEFAIRIGLACHSEITRENYFARKNYFYPDLPKGYQLSQHTTPICKGGHILINLPGGEKKIRLNRIHLEEDAGKSLHDQVEEDTVIDLNRAGIPLIEIVSEPDLSSGDEAFAYLNELRRLVRYLRICDGNMEEGSLRCDANVSVKRRSDTSLGTKVEIKNLNSMRNVKDAIEFESRQMIEKLDTGLSINQETKSFDADSGRTVTIRDKEDAEDYRYFPDPDLTKFSLADEFIENVRKTVPALPAQRIKKYVREYQLSQYDASLLTDDRDFSDYFEQAISAFESSRVQPDRSTVAKAAANWLLGPVKSWLNHNKAEISNFPIAAEKLMELVLLVDSGRLSFSTASTKLFNELLSNPAADPRELAEGKDLLKESDIGTIEALIQTVLDRHPDKVNEYRKGKKGLMGLFVGEVMKLSNGKADPKITNDILSQKLKL